MVNVFVHMQYMIVFARVRKNKCCCGSYVPEYLVDDVFQRMSERVEGVKLFVIFLVMLENNTKKISSHKKSPLSSTVLEIFSKSFHNP